MSFEYKTIDIPFWTMAKAALLVIFLIGVWILRDVVGIVLLSIVIASAIEPAAHWCTKNKIPRVLGVLGIYVVAAFGVLSVLYFVVPPLVGDAFEVVSTLPQFVNEIVHPGSKIFSIFPKFPEAINTFLNGLAVRMSNLVPGLTQDLFSASSRLVGGFLSLVLLVVLSFYLSVQEHGIENFLRVITPRSHEDYILDLWSRSQQKIGRWLQGQLLLGLLVGLFVFLGLTILNVRHAVLLGILSAVFEVIPVFGPIMAAIPAIAVAAIQEPILGLWVLLLYFVVQQFENHLIYPLVVRKTIGVPPLLVVISLVVGAKLAGVMGIILSVPIAAVFVEFINDLAVKKRAR